MLQRHAVSYQTILLYYCTFPRESADESLQIGEGLTELLRRERCHVGHGVVQFICCEQAFAVAWPWDLAERILALLRETVCLFVTIATDRRTPGCDIKTTSINDEAAFETATRAR